MILLCSHNSKLKEHWLKGLAREGESIAEIDRITQLSSKLNGSSDVLLLLDLDGESREPVSLMTELCASHPGIRPFALSSKPNPGQGIALAKAGVRGYGNSWMHPETLRQSSRLIQSGEVWLGQEVIQLLIKGAVADDQSVAASTRLSGLTAREREITQRVAVGESNKLIAYELGITERTVKAHMSKIFHKTAVKDRLQLALLVNSKSN